MSNSTELTVYKPKLFLTMCKGLPGSGKSTWALTVQRLAKQSGENVTVISKDDIRRELTATGWEWSHEAEKEVVAYRDKMIIDALARGISVISSDTNFGKKHEPRLRQLAAQYKAVFNISDFTKVPLEVCIERDKNRSEDARVGEKVIRDMYVKFIGVEVMEKYEPVPGTPLAVICDLDGTLALAKGVRGIFDYAKCAKDRVNKPVYDLIKLLAENGTQIVYLSGREDWCRPQTEDFLATNNCPKGPLFMRASKDHRKDDIVKQELFNEHVRKQYNVRFVLDDRDRVVKMWRELGLTCLQVAEGNF